MHLLSVTGSVATPTIDALVPALVSTHGAADLARAFAFVGDSEAREALETLTRVALVHGRLLHARRALEHARRLAAARDNRLRAQCAQRLVDELRTRRWHAVDGALDARMLAFEFERAIMLREAQVDVLRAFARAAERDDGAHVRQLIMGHGKTTVIAPLLALMLASRDALVTVCVPDALVGMSQRALAAALGGLWRRRVASVAFSRHSLGDVDPVGGARRLRRRLELCAPVVATASTLKALVLRVVELAGRQCDAFGCETDGEFVSRAHERAELAKLRGAVALFGAAERGVLLLDKVDVLLHALKSELHFPVGDDAPLELSDERSDIVLRLVSLVFDGHDKDVAECVERMIERCEMSREPHLLLVDRAAYAQHLQPTLARALLAWLRTQLRRHGTAFAAVRVVDATASSVRDEHSAECGGLG